MRAKVLSLALLAAVIALPFPASGMLAGTFSAPARPMIVGTTPGTLATLIEDPFLAAHLSFTPAKSAADAG